ncbi:unnamed protein product [Lupinus luteus]|uniref:Beta-glucosidase n=1 Tax=Lupinus luteus TaxID=3873 RepID=A0AAV1YEA4_LUPLU
MAQHRDNDIQGGSIGTILSAPWLLPATNTEKDIVATQRAKDFMIGWFLDPLIFGDYPCSMKSRVGSRLPKFSEAESALVKGSLDFLGISHFTSLYVKDISAKITKILLNDAMTDLDNLKRYPKQSAREKEWLLKCLVGRTVRSVAPSDVLSILKAEGILTVSAHVLGSDLILLSPLDDEVMEEVMKDADDRLSFVFVEEVGSLLELDDLSRTRSSFEFFRMRVRTSVVSTVDKVLVVDIDGIMVNIGVWEEAGGVVAVLGGHGVQKGPSWVLESEYSKAIPDNVAAWLSVAMDSEWRSAEGEGFGGGGGVGSGSHAA